jgi:hypothetical protein
MYYSQQFPINPNLNSGEKFYNNIYTSNTNPIFFNFKERSGKLKWKEIMRIDLDSMIRANDISSLETYLENLIFSEVNENDIEIITESSTVRLIKIYQYILEYLLHTQIRLENENKMLETNYTSILSDSLVKENTLKENKSMIRTLKKDKRDKEMILNTYKCIIDEYKSSNFNGNATYNPNQNPNQNSNLNRNNTNNNTYNTRRNPNKISKSTAPPADLGVNSNNNNPDREKERDKKYFYCNFCLGKKFSTEEFLQNHINRRHANNNNNNFNNTIGNTVRTDLDISDLRQSKRDYVKNLENQVDELKGLFKTFMNNNNNINNESLNKLAENQKVLESKIVEVKYDKDKLLNVMEENFKITLMEIKEFVKNNNNNNNSLHDLKAFSQENFNKENSINEKEISNINNNLNNINDIINEIKNNQNKKIDIVYEEIKNFKSSISCEIRDLKINNNTNVNNNNLNQQHLLNQNFHSFSDVKNFKLQSESVEIPNTYSNTYHNQNNNDNKNNNNNNNDNKNNNINSINYLQNQIQNKNDLRSKNIKVIKHNFNSGNLESDYSDEEYLEENIYIKNSNEKKQSLIVKHPNALSSNNNTNNNQRNSLKRNSKENNGEKLNTEKEINEQNTNIFDKNKLKYLEEKDEMDQIQLEENEQEHENIIEAEEKLMDVSNFTKEKNEIIKTKTVKSNKKNDEHEIILDNNSPNNTQDSKFKNEKLNKSKSEIKEICEKENKNEDKDKEKQDLINNKFSFGMKNENEKEKENIDSNQINFKAKALDDNEKDARTFDAKEKEKDKNLKDNENKKRNIYGGNESNSVIQLQTENILNSNSNQISKSNDNNNYNSNHIKINDLKNETFLNVEVKKENVENVRSKIMDQFTLREEMFKNSNFNYKNIENDNNDIDNDNYNKNKTNKNPNESLGGYKRIL